MYTSANKLTEKSKYIGVHLHTLVIIHKIYEPKHKPYTTREAEFCILRLISNDKASRIIKLSLCFLFN